ncbi:hypothetical protein Gpo141_00013301 [Globisporangium polare]
MMATNGEVSAHITAKKGDPPQGLAARLLQRHGAEEGGEATAARESAAATAGAADDGRYLQFGDLLVVTRLGAHTNDDATDESLAVDYEPSDQSEAEDGGVVATVGGTQEDWDAFQENRAQDRHLELHELDENPSAVVVSMYRTEEENDALRAVKARESAVVTNHETGLEPIAEGTITYSLPIMPPPEQWLAGWQFGREPACEGTCALG